LKRSRGSRKKRRSSRGSKRKGKWKSSWRKRKKNLKIIRRKRNNRVDSSVHLALKKKRGLRSPKARKRKILDS